MADAEPNRLIEIPFEVGPHEHGLRLDLFLARRMKRMSRTLAARLVREGRVRRTPPGSLKASARVFLGETVILKRKPMNEASPDDVVVPVVYADDDLVAVNKPGNLVVHPTASHYHRTLIRIMRDRMGEESLDLAHRIDKETSGLVLIARHFEAASRLKGQFARRQVEKSYLAIVVGCPGEDQYAVEVPMRLADTVSNVVMEVVSSKHPDAQPALTDVFVLARGRDAALVEARPKTGRQHQIRVHLAHLGHPIVGDKLYLGGEDFFLEAIQADYPADLVDAQVGHDRQALHAWKAAFTHPALGQRTELAAPLPPDLRALAERRGIPVPEADERLEGEEARSPTTPDPWLGRG